MCKMSDTHVVDVKPNIETVKRLLLEDLNKLSTDFTKDQHESSFCEIDPDTPTKIKVTRTYTRPTPQKRVLKSLENTLYSPRASPNTIQKHKRKRVIEEDDDAANRSIVEITEQFKKVDDFELAVE